MDDRETRAAAVHMALSMARDSGHCFDDAQELVAASNEIYDFLTGKSEATFRKVMVKENLPNGGAKRHFAFEPVDKSDPLAEARKIATGTNNE